MTDRTTYYQRKNRHALTNGGIFRCPSCIGVVDETDDGYRCTHCNYYWDADGDITEEPT